MKLLLLNDIVCHDWRYIANDLDFSRHECSQKAELNGW